MTLFKVDCVIESKESFNIDELKRILKQNLEEVRYSLYNLKYHKREVNILPEIPLLNKKCDRLVFYIPVNDYFNYRTALGCFTSLPFDEYKEFNIYSIKCSYETI